MSAAKRFKIEMPAERSEESLVEIYQFKNDEVDLNGRGHSDASKFTIG